MIKPPEYLKWDAADASTIIVEAFRLVAEEIDLNDVQRLSFPRLSKTGPPFGAQMQESKHFKHKHVDQHCHLEDDFFGWIYFPVDESLWLVFEYSC